MKYLFLILLITLTIGCKKSNSKENAIIQNTDKKEVVKHEAILKLSILSKEKITPWKEYKNVKENIIKFENISASEALNNALHIAKVIKQLKDSIRPKALLTPSFRTRVNVLENEALRLKDMTFISAITNSEVNKQVEKILQAFSATNSKINTVYAQLSVETEIKIQQSIK